MVAAWILDLGYQVCICFFSKSLCKGWGLGRRIEQLEAPVGSFRADSVPDIALTADSARRLTLEENVEVDLAPYEEFMGNYASGELTSVNVEMDFVLGAASKMKYMPAEQVRTHFDLDDEEFRTAQALSEIDHDAIPDWPHAFLVVVGDQDGSEREVARGKRMMEGVATILMASEWTCDMSSRATRESCDDMPMTVNKMLDAMLGLDEASHEIGRDRDGYSL